MSTSKPDKMRLGVGVSVVTDFLHGQVSDADQLDMYHKKINKVVLSDDATEDDLRIPKLNLVDLRILALTSEYKIIRYQDSTRLGEGNHVAHRRSARHIMNTPGVIRVAVITEVWASAYHKETHAHLLELKQSMTNKE